MVYTLIRTRFEGQYCNGTKATLVADFDEPTGAILMPNADLHNITIKVIHTKGFASNKHTLCLARQCVEHVPWAIPLQPLMTPLKHHHSIITHKHNTRLRPDYICSSQNLVFTRANMSAFSAGLRGLRFGQIFSLYIENSNFVKLRTKVCRFYDSETWQCCRRGLDNNTHLFVFFSRKC